MHRIDDDRMGAHVMGEIIEFTPRPGTGAHWHRDHWVVSINGWIAYQTREEASARRFAKDLAIMNGEDDVRLHRPAVHYGEADIELSDQGRQGHQKAD